MNISILRSSKLTKLLRKLHTSKIRWSDDKKCPEKKCFMQPSCKVALITGGSEGIGFSIANHILKHGAKGVALTGLNVCNGKNAVNCLNGAYGKNKAIFINSDSNCMVQLDEAFKVTKEVYQNIDIVVNSAGICNGCKWETEIVTNIIGTIRTTLLGFRYVGREGCGNGGVIINVSGLSGIAKIPPAPTLACCHAGIIGLSRNFGDKLHFDKSGVRVVCLCPGITTTNFFKNVESQGMTDTLSDELKRFVKAAKTQKPDVAGLAAVHLIKYGDSGTVWILDASRLFLYQLPEWEKCSVLEKQYL